MTLAPVYNPARPPFVTHFEGNRLIFDYIETFVCPTTTSASILGGQPFVFEGDAVASVRNDLSLSHFLPAKKMFGRG